MEIQSSVYSINLGRAWWGIGVFKWQDFFERFGVKIASVAIVSVGFSARSSHFSFWLRGNIGRKMEGGGGEARKGTFLRTAQFYGSVRKLLLRRIKTVLKVFV